MQSKIVVFCRGLLKVYTSRHAGIITPVSSRSEPTCCSSRPSGSEIGFNLEYADIIRIGPSDWNGLVHKITPDENGYLVRSAAEIERNRVDATSGAYARVVADHAYASRCSEAVANRRGSQEESQLGGSPQAGTPSPQTCRVCMRHRHSSKSCAASSYLTSATAIPASYPFFYVGRGVGLTCFLEQVSRAGPGGSASACS